MAFVIQMPKLGHTTTEGTVIQWHKREGESIREGEPILTVETDKAQVEVEAPVAGVLGRRVVGEGEIAPVGAPLGVITAAGEAVPAEYTSARPSASGAGAQVASAQSASGATASTPRSAPSGRVAASPRAKRLAAESGIDLSTIQGTGTDGLISEDDVRKAIAAKGTATTAATASSVAPSHVEKLTRIQAAGARNVTTSWQNVPHFVQMVRVDMSRAMAARSAINASGAKLTVTDVILAATVRTLKENPRVNATYRDGEMLIYDRVNLGVAIDTPDGLVVAVVHNADGLDVKALSARVSEIAERARNRQLRPEDVEGATFTVSNLGAYGVENGTPVIFSPLAALMFVGAIRDEVLAVDGKAEVRPAMHLAIAYDHRGIDGAAASRFTTGMKKILEAPDFLGAPAAQEPAAKPSRITTRPREVIVESIGETLETSVQAGSLSWQLSGDDASVGPDPVTTFLSALGGCLLMSLRVAARVRKANIGHAAIVARANEKGHVKEIDVELEVESSEDDERLHKLIEVAERGCHIRQLIKDDIEVRLKVNRIQ
ncbi:MAG TPA: 2-oxo acid dehydrogenase subunit E2 [Candidatus Binataceae bacterium]|nr:2-oxo acid dehydrogenase subunit E2 [Candidatus Binataceae bacterium]